MTEPRYGVAAYWSEEDGCWIAVVPGLPGCTAHGDTWAGALAEIDTALRLRIESAVAHGDALPPPRFRPVERMASDRWDARSKRALDETAPQS